MNKNLKPFIIILIMFLCAVALIGCMYYEKTVQTFNPMRINQKVIGKMNENNASYLELKQSLKEKYSNEFLEMLKGVKTEYSTKVREILGEEYILLRDNLVDIENGIRQKRHDFLNSEEYVAAKTEMTKAKLKFDISNDQNKEENEKALQNAVSNISTLNTKLNNQLKDLNQEENSVRAKLKTLFDSKKTELVEIKKQTEEKTQKSITKILYEYFIGLKNLNINFGVNTDNQEMPFSDDFIKSFNVYTNFEKDYFNGNLNNSTPINHDIITDNSNIILN